MAAFGLLCLLVLACGESSEHHEPAQSSARGETFTFFDLGRDTRCSDAIREELHRKLGDEGFEQRTIIDLESNYPGFLAAHLPELDTLNRKLNYPPGERVDHPVTQLTYRYARQQGAAFDKVVLTFDGDTGLPLLFRISFKKDDLGLIGTLREKYGSPQVVDWEKDGGQSLIWQREQDYMMASRVPDQFGGFGHQITIYFTENLQARAASEQAAREQKERQREREGKAAF